MTSTPYFLGQIQKSIIKTTWPTVLSRRGPAAPAPGLVCGSSSACSCCPLAQIPPRPLSSTFPFAVSVARVKAFSSGTAVGCEIVPGSLGFLHTCLIVRHSDCLNTPASALTSVSALDACSPEAVGSTPRSGCVTGHREGPL